MDFHAMIQTVHLEEYAVPVSVLFVFLLLIHQRHRLGSATHADFEDERHPGIVRSSGRIQRAASAVAEMHDFDADETTGSIDSEGGLEYPPSPSDSLSSNMESGGYNGVATGGGAAYSVAAAAVGVGRSTSRYPQDEYDASDVPGAPRDVALAVRRSEEHSSLSPSPRSATASSSAVRGLHTSTSGAAQISRLSSRSSGSQARLGMSSRAPQAYPVTTRSAPAAGSSCSVEFLQPKMEPDDDGDIFDENVPMSTPLPPKWASTPRTPTKARGGHAFTPDAHLASDDAPPLSSPLPPKHSASARTSTSVSRNNSTLYTSSASRGSSSAGSRVSGAARSLTATPSSASALRAPSSMSSNATPPPSSLGGSSSATPSRSRAGTPDDRWTPFSRMSSLSPTPSEVAERWVRQVSARSTPSTENVEDDTGRRVVTTWFESSSQTDTLIDYPPNLRDHPDLQPGDLFYHHTANHYQLWIWEVNNDGILCWVRVKFMSERNGMCLTLTPKDRHPSWVTPKYAHSRKRLLFLQGYEV